MWHEASVIEMRENHNVMVLKELLMAGDVELNPGPYPPGMFITVMFQYYLKTHYMAYNSIMALIIVISM